MNGLEPIGARLVPANFGPLKSFNAHARVEGSCGDTMEFWVLHDQFTVKAASFTTDGCDTSVASGSVAAHLSQGMSLGEVRTLGPAGRDGRGLPAGHRRRAPLRAPGPRPRGGCDPRHHAPGRRHSGCPQGRGLLPRRQHSRAGHRGEHERLPLPFLRDAHARLPLRWGCWPRRGAGAALPGVGTLPLDPAVAQGGDAGHPRLFAGTQGAAAEAFQPILQRLLEGAGVRG